MSEAQRLRDAICEATGMKPDLAQNAEPEEIGRLLAQRMEEAYRTGYDHGRADLEWVPVTP